MTVVSNLFLLSILVLSFFFFTGFTASVFYFSLNYPFIAFPVHACSYLASISSQCIHLHTPHSASLSLFQQLIPGAVCHVVRVWCVAAPWRRFLFTTHQSTTWVILHQATERAWCLAPLSGQAGGGGRRNGMEKKNEKEEQGAEKGRQGKEDKKK